MISTRNSASFSRRAAAAGRRGRMACLAVSGHRVEPKSRSAAVRARGPATPISSAPGRREAGGGARARGPAMGGLVPEDTAEVGGVRIEPPMSEPSSSAAKPAASAAAEPPDEPPGLRGRSQGLLVGRRRVVLCQSASERHVGLAEDDGAGRLQPRDGRRPPAPKSLKGGRPQVVGRPATLKDSLTVIGRPSSGSRSPRARGSIGVCRRCAGPLEVADEDGVESPSSASMRAMAASASSAAETSFVKSDCASSPALR